MKIPRSGYLQTNFAIITSLENVEINRKSILLDQEFLSVPSRLIVETDFENKKPCQKNWQG